MALLIGGAIAAGAGLLGAGSGAAAGIGKDTTQTTTFGQTQQYNPNAFQYGGTPGGADEAANRYRQQAEAAQGRGATQADWSNAQPNFDRAQQWDTAAGVQTAQSQQARAGQGDVANLMMQRATGQVPSIAGMQANQQILALRQGGAEQARAAMAAQGAQAASARGAAGVALAQQGAANNVANAQGAIGQATSQGVQNISNQAQINAANERMQAEQGALGAYSTMRGGDFTGQGLNFQGQQNASQQELARAQLGTQQATTNAQLQAQQRAQNDTYSAGLTGNEQNVRQQQLQGGIANQQVLSGSQQAQQQQVAQQGAHNADTQMKWVDTAFKAAEAGGGGPPAKAAGGPVRGGFPYLMNEQGRETLLSLKRGGGRPQAQVINTRGPAIVTPKQDGFVIPAPQTAMMLAKGGQSRMTGMGARDTNAMLDWRQNENAARMNHEAGGDIGQEVLAKPYSGDTPADARTRTPADDAEAAAASNRAMGIEPDRTPEQRAFEDRLTGAEPSLEDSNQAEAAKIRASFVPNETAGQWERINGPASEANAGVRDGGPKKPSLGMGILQGFSSRFGGHREEGGPVEAGKTYVVNEAGPEAIAPVAPRRMQSFERDRPAERAQDVATAGQLATALLHPASAGAAGAQILAEEGAYHANHAAETAGSIPTRKPLTLAKGGGARGLVFPSREQPPEVDPQDAEPQEEFSRGPTTAMAQAYLSRLEREREAEAATQEQIADGPNPLPTPRLPPLEAPEKKQEPMRVATMSRATISRGRKRGPK